MKSYYSLAPQGKVLAPISSPNSVGESEQDDLLISPYLHTDALPHVLRSMLALAPTDAQRDMLLLSTLTSVSSVMPRLHFRYGENGKPYYANLQTFIMAPAASGKGIAGLGRALVEDIHRKRSLLIPGDSTYPAFFIQLAWQNGRGLLFETEGSVITDTWRSQARSYNTALRQAAEHETISRSRADSGMEEITNPKLSCLLTGTFDQFHALIPSVQNGFYSRLVTYVDRSPLRFLPSVFKSTTGVIENNSEAVLTECRGHINRLYKQLDGLKSDREFRLTDEQAAILGRCFEQQYEPLITELGASFHASVVRMGITAMRILMILSALRAEETDSLIVKKVENGKEGNELPALYATEDDFRTAVLIAGKLILHTADSFTQIRGDQTPALPASRSSVQRTTFLAQLPDKFTTAEYNSVATNLGVSTRTMARWLSCWAEDGTFTKICKGYYSKCA